MYKTMAGIASVLLSMTGMALAEPQTYSPPPPAATIQLNTEFLSDLMRSAAMFNGMVQNLDLNRTLHESGVVQDRNYPQRPGKRAAAVIGAGAGVGLALGSMTGSQKGAMIGAAVGGASALVIDQMVQHQAKARLDSDAYRDSHPDYDGGYQYDRHHFKQRTNPQQ